MTNLIEYYFSFLYDGFMQPVSTSNSLPQDFYQEDIFRKFIETEVLKIIKNLAEKGETPQERIQAIARTTLDRIKPGMKIDELYMSAVKLDDEYSELAPIVITIMKNYEENFARKAIQGVSSYIKKGDYDSAQELVKKVLMFKIAK